MKISPRHSWIALTVAAFGAGTALAEDSRPGDGRGLIPPTGITKVRVLSQNWTDEEANKYYNLTQGSQMMPYAWFLHLEQADSTTKFRDASNMLKFGYLPRKPDNGDNKDGLPIGFVKNGNQIGLNCANCHTGQINYKGTTLLVDGGPTMSNATAMLEELEAALKATLTSSEKFARLAKAVLGADDSEASRAQMKKDLEIVLKMRGDYNARNFPHGAQPAFGPGRIDAFGAIMNEVVVRFAKSPTPPAAADAPVSFPFLWDTPQHDVVQWNGSATNTVVPLLKPLLGTEHLGALGRNVGEVLGVFGDVNTEKEEFPLGYASSVNHANLIEIEETLRALWSPQWPEDQFGKPDAGLAAKGKDLYNIHCVKCHVILEGAERMNINRKVKAMMSNEGTDQTMAFNVATRKADSGILKGRLLLTLPPRKLEAEEPVAILLQHVSQRVVFGHERKMGQGDVGMGYTSNAEIGHGPGRIVLEGIKKLEMKKGILVSAIGKLVKSHEPEPSEEPAPSAASEEPKVAITAGVKSMKVESAPGAAEPVELQYKARPLNGIWATAPYLHNGSVPNLDELLKAPEKRAKSFKVGSREFDPVNVGFVTNEGQFTFDTSLHGNSNAGHKYAKELSDDERKQLIEYLKTL